jgi:hypothetical protein
MADEIGGDDLGGIGREAIVAIAFLDALLIAVVYDLKSPLGIDSQFGHEGHVDTFAPHVDALDGIAAEYFHHG